MQKYLPILRARRERRLARQKKNSARARGLALTIGMVVSALAGALILALAFAYADLTRDLPSTAILPRLLNPPDGALLEPTRLYDRTGEHLLFVFAPTDAPRRYIPVNPQNPQHIPEDMLNAIVAAQDPQFYSHAGYVWQGYDDPEAHPTLAQKLVSDLILYNEKPSLRRAVRERILAAQITAQFGRGQILEWYLNSANFGNYAYGIEAAAQLYFGKTASNLTLAEAAILAATSEAPALNPLDAPQAALQRGRELVYTLNGLGRISSERAALALIEQPQIQPAPAQPLDEAPAFRALAMAQISKFLPRERIERGGIKIIATLDAYMQRETRCVTEWHAARIAGLPEPSAECKSARLLPALPPSAPLSASSAAALILDAQTGQILAMTGETQNAVETPVSLPHPAGSALDTFVYLTAFARGFSPASLVWDIPSAAGVENFDGKFHGPARMRAALINDYQTPLENLKAQLGAENILKIEESFGIRSEEIRLTQLAGAYAVFAAQGVYFGREIEGEMTPYAALRVEDLDHAVLLDWSLPQSKPVLPATLAYLTTHVLSDESIREAPDALHIGRPAGVKVGQTREGKDAWVVGFTPARVIAAWTGTRGESESVKPRVAAALWKALALAASENSPADGWSAPPGISPLTVCDPSGMLPTRECPRLVNEVFLQGNEPSQADALYREFEINRETNLLATVFTPPELIEKRTYLIVPEEARGWALGAGIPIPPASYDAIQPPPILPTANIASPALFAEIDEDVVKIIGTASGADFQYYRLQFGQGLNPREWIQIGADSTTPVENGVLAEWDVRELSGLYAVHLLVVRQDQRVDTAVLQVAIK